MTARFERRINMGKSIRIFVIKRTTIFFFSPKQRPSCPKLIMADWPFVSKIASNFLRVDETAKSLRLVSDFLVVKNIRFPDSSKTDSSGRRGIFLQATTLNIYLVEIPKSNIKYFIDKYSFCYFLSSNQHQNIFWELNILRIWFFKLKK